MPTMVEDYFCKAINYPHKPKQALSDLHLIPFPRLTDAPIAAAATYSGKMFAEAAVVLQMFCLCAVTTAVV